MTGTIAVLAALVGALNPSVLARRQQGRPTARWLIGVLIGVVAALVLAGLAEPIRDALSVSEPTFRTAAGAALALTGARWLVGPSPRAGEADPTVEGTLSAFTPAVVLTAMATTAEDGWWITAVGLGVAVAVSAGLGAAEYTRYTGHAGTVGAWAVRAFGGLAVVAGIGLVVSGVEMI